MRKLFVFLLVAFVAACTSHEDRVESVVTDYVKNEYKNVSEGRVMERDTTLGEVKKQRKIDSLSQVSSQLGKRREYATLEQAHKILAEQGELLSKISDIQGSMKDSEPISYKVIYEFQENHRPKKIRMWIDYDFKVIEVDEI